MKVSLKGVASATKRLADGSQKKYFYAWRGGPLLKGLPGSPEFFASYTEAHANAKKEKATDTFYSLIRTYRTSSDFSKLAPSSKRAYNSYLDLIERKFGDLPIAALSDLRIRGDFKSWRDSMSATPRKADYAWTTLAKVLSYAKDNGRIATNPCERGGRLYESERVDRIWTDEDLAKLEAVASPEVWNVVLAALWTGQRQSDLLELTWDAYDGSSFRLIQGKTKRRVTVPCGAPLKRVLKRLKRTSDEIFLNSRKKPWTADGFRTSFAAAMKEAGLADADLHFHDLRGTAVTRLFLAECTEGEIATFTGHSLVTIRAILDKHYFSRDEAIGKSAIRKLEKSRKAANRLQTKKPRKG